MQLDMILKHKTKEGVKDIARAGLGGGGGLGVNKILAWADLNWCGGQGRKGSSRKSHGPNETLVRGHSSESHVGAGQP